MQGTPARVAAIGRATAAAFGDVDLIPEIATQEGLLAELPRPAGRVLFAGAEGARQLIVQELGAEFVPLYRTRAIRPPACQRVTWRSSRRPRRRGRWRRSSCDARRLDRAGDDTGRQRRGLTVRAEAATHDAAGLVAAVQDVAPAPS